MRTILILCLLACSKQLAPVKPVAQSVTAAPALTVLRVLHAADGYRIRDSFSVGPDKALYETAWQGGTGTWDCSTPTKQKTCSCGTVQRLDPATGSFSVVHDFSALANGRNGDGCNSVGPVSFHGGRAWVVSQAGGIGGNPIRAALGAISSMDLDGGNFVREYDFGVPAPHGGYIDGGGGSQGGLVWDEARGIAYGVVSAGVFVYDPVAHTAIVMYGFSARAADGTNATGSNPYGTPVLTPWGTLIGVTYYGGMYGRGVVYELDPKTWVERVIYHLPAYTFTGNTDNTPIGSPIVASDGSVYVAISYGGANGSGMLLKIERTATSLHEYGVYPYAADGAIPLGTITEGSNGDLYETTMYGDAGYGTISAVGKDGRRFKKVLSFMYAATAGASSTCYPYAGMLAVGTKLFGTTGLCGDGYGVIFTVDVQ